jgi:hypothetical protein
MPPPNLGALRAVADRLDQLGQSYAFVGGSIVNLLVDDPELSPARPTDDVDVILEIVASDRYSAMEAQLRRLGFAHDTREHAPLCRWTLGAVTVDIMPTAGDGLGLNTTWFAEALSHRDGAGHRPHHAVADFSCGFPRDQIRGVRRPREWRLLCQSRPRGPACCHRRSRGHRRRSRRRAPGRYVIISSRHCAPSQRIRYSRKPCRDICPAIRQASNGCPACATN